MQCTTLQMAGATFTDLWKTMGPGYNNTFGRSLREVSQLRGIYIHHRNMHKNVNISAEASPNGFSFLRTIKWGASAKNELWQKCFFSKYKTLCLSE